MVVWHDSDKFRKGASVAKGTKKTHKHENWQRMTTISWRKYYFVTISVIEQREVIKGKNAAINHNLSKLQHQLKKTTTKIFKRADLVIPNPTLWMALLKYRSMRISATYLLYSLPWEGEAAVGGEGGQYSKRRNSVLCLPSSDTIRVSDTGQFQVERPEN